MKRYCFVDMHTHCVYSNEEGCVQTPREILDKVYEIVQKERLKDFEYTANLLLKYKTEQIEEHLQKYYGLESQEEKDILHNCFSLESVEDVCNAITKNFVKACLSISDHNSILGSLEAHDIIAHNEKYSCIDFIMGIEFNASLKELGLNRDGKSVYSKCHVLAYNYRPDDETMKLFSELFQLTIGRQDINIGQTVCASRNAIKTKYNIKIPFKEFKNILSYAKLYQFDKKGIDAVYKTIRQNFVEICEKYLSKKQMKEFKPELEEMFPLKTTTVNENIGQAKLAISEIAEMVTNAGGVISIAHPRIIGYNKTIAHTDEEFRQMLDDFIPRVQQATNNRLYAIEAYHPNCSDNLSAIIDCAKKYNLYLTGGSDNHGDQIHIDNKISRCFGKGYEYNSVATPVLWQGEVKNRVISLAVLDQFFNKPYKHTDKLFTVCKMVDGKIYYIDEIIKNSNRSRESFIKLTKNRPVEVKEPKKKSAPVKTTKPKGKKKKTKKKKEKKLTPKQRRILRQKLEKEKQEKKKKKQIIENDAEQNKQTEEQPIEQPIEQPVEQKIIEEVKNLTETQNLTERPSNLMTYKKQWKKSSLKRAKERDIRQQTIDDILANNLENIEQLSMDLGDKCLQVDNQPKKYSHKAKCSLNDDYTQVEMNLEEITQKDNLNDDNLER